MKLNGRKLRTDKIIYSFAKFKFKLSSYHNIIILKICVLTFPLAKVYLTSVY